MSELYQKVMAGWPLIIAAPETFAAIFFAFVFVAVPSIWFVLSWSYRTRLESLQARLGSKDDQIASVQRQRDEYKDKLSGASPEEARGRIDALEQRLMLLEHRKLTGEQREAIIRVLGSAAGAAHMVQVAYDMACADCSNYAAALRSAIGAVPDWTAQPAMIMGAAVQSAKGLAILVPDLNNLGQTASLLMRAFSEAGLPHETLQAHQGGFEVTTARVLVSVRAA